MQSRLSLASSVGSIRGLFTPVIFYGLCVLCGLFTLFGAAVPEAAAAVVVKSGDASISHDAPSGTWSITAGGTTLTLALDPSSDFQIIRLATTSNKVWTVGTVPDTSVTINGAQLPFGSRAAGFVYQNATASTIGTTLRLDAVFDLPGSALRVTRHYAVTSGSPTFETWNTYTPLGGMAAVADLNGFQFTVPSGTVRWLTGLQGDNADVDHESAFTRRSKTLADGEHFTLGSQGRSSEQTIPWFAVDGSNEEFYASLMWSGAWSLTIDRSGGNLSLSLGLGPMTTTLSGREMDGPHALFGVARGNLIQATAALRSYVLQGLRGGQMIFPLVTYNTWFAYGTALDEAGMRDAMTQAAALGVELFVIDAGWYTGAGAHGPMDFDAGLGTWQADPARFPNGLKPLTDYAHSLGMRFGLWVEPERVNLSVVGSNGLQESMLATNHGNYGSDHAAQMCFASEAGRQWVLSRLTALLDATQPDYLKWDNNMWVNCDRAGHSHGASDGNYAHVSALYDVLGQIQGRYPSLLIENVSSGGNRLDLGMLRHSDVAWMDDRTAPSSHVRHNVEGLSSIFPPAYLLSFVTEHAGEPLHNAPDMSLYFRSRMEGTLGLCFRFGDLSASDTAAMAREISLYKTMRATLGTAAAALLSAQASVLNGPAWDVLQETVSGSSHVLLYAFQSSTGTGKIPIKPTGLSPGAMYEVRSVDTGLLATVKGSDLMANGIDVYQSPNSAAHILIITAK
jgi:alpha-galactosidase